MAPIVILAAVCAAGVLFLLRFLVAICGEDGRGKHVVHVLPLRPEHDGGRENLTEPDPKVAVEDVSLTMSRRRVVPVVDLDLPGRQRGGPRRRTAV